VVSVPEIRDYSRINAELVALLNLGHPRVRLVGVDRQRLLVYGLSGSWSAVVHVEGHAGPELAAELDAPNLTVVCNGSVADGAGRSIRAGRLIIAGEASAALGYNLSGGVIVVGGNAGPRLGLEMREGLILVGGSAGRLSGERQRGGRVVVAGSIGPVASLGRQAGRLSTLADTSIEDRAAIREEFLVSGAHWPAGLPFSMTMK